MNHALPMRLAGKALWMLAAGILPMALIVLFRLRTEGEVTTSLRFGLLMGMVTLVAIVARVLGEDRARLAVSTPTC